MDDDGHEGMGEMSGGGGKSESATVTHSAAYSTERVQLLAATLEKAKDKMSWEDFKEKHMK